MAIPKVVIVGRPNVGKSSLFNWLIGKRVAIVDPTAGVTRDRISYLLELNDRFVELVDTGGMGIADSDGLTQQIEKQIDQAIEDAALLLFVVDAQTGILPLDQHVIKKLRYIETPLLCVVNKCDNDKFRQDAAAEFYKFGRKLVFASTTTGFGKEELKEAVLEKLPPEEAPVPSEVLMKLAVVGKRNVGKSTFINALAKSERMIVSEIPGTTRDSVDVRFEHHGRVFLAIDTAGVRKETSLADSIEFYSYSRAQRTIRRADVVLFFLDASSRISKVDKQLAQYIIEQAKPCVVVVNKWDLMRATPTGKFNYYLEDTLPHLKFAPRAFITARTGKNIQALVDLSESLYKQANTRAETADVNRVIQEAMRRRPAPVRLGKVPKVYYATQVAVAPPTLVLFCNSPKSFDPTYQRYLISYCREKLPFAEVPIRMYLRKRDSSSGGKPGEGGTAEQETLAEWEGAGELGGDGSSGPLSADSAKGSSFDSPPGKDRVQVDTEETLRHLRESDDPTNTEDPDSLPD